MRLRITGKSGWIGGPEDKPEAITVPNAPPQVVKKYASKKPLRRPTPPKKGKKK